MVSCNLTYGPQANKNKTRLVTDFLPKHRFVRNFIRSWWSHVPLKRNSLLLYLTYLLFSVIILASFEAYLAVPEPFLASGLGYFLPFFPFVACFEAHFAWYWYQWWLSIHSFNGNGEYKNVLFTPSQSSKAQPVYKINCSLHNQKWTCQFVCEDVCTIKSFVLQTVFYFQSDVKGVLSEVSL